MEYACSEHSRSNTFHVNKCCCSGGCSSDVGCSDEALVNVVEWIFLPSQGQQSIKKNKSNCVRSTRTLTEMNKLNYLLKNKGVFIF